MYTFHDNLGQLVTLTFNPAVFTQRMAHHVLVFPLYQGKLLFTIHTTRGIELPGGKVEPGETSMAAAVRETFEETGYALSLIEKIGQYTVGETIVKDIFFAHVEGKVMEVKEGTVGGALLFDEIPEPEMVKDNPKFSPFLYDHIYPITVEYLRSRQLLPCPTANSEVEWKIL